jgi:hypothetical protein
MPGELPITCRSAKRSGSFRFQLFNSPNCWPQLDSFIPSSSLNSFKTVLQVYGSTYFLLGLQHRLAVAACQISTCIRRSLATTVWAFPLRDPALTMRLMISYSASAAAMVVCSALVSYAGATSTMSAPIRLIPSKPRMMVRSSRVDQPPVSGVPVAGATGHVSTGYTPRRMGRNSYKPGREYRYQETGTRDWSSQHGPKSS